MNRRSRAGWLAIAAALALTGMSRAQAVTPVQHFDLKKFSGAWYEVLRSPVKDNLKCVSEPTVLYTQVDKPRRFASVRSCSTKGGFLDASNYDGRLAEKTGDTGALKVRTIWPLWKKFDVAALAPDGAWAILATTNRKMVWVLTRQPKPNADTMTQLRQSLTQLGFDASRMVSYP